MENQNTPKKKFYHHYNSNYSNKPKAVSYLKSFNTFEEGYSEILKFNPEIKNYCGDTPIYDAVISSMMESIKNDIPSPSNPNYPNTLSLSIDSGEVGFKTDINVAIGWRIAYNYHEAKSFYKFRITFISIPVYKKDVITKMEEAGWSKLDPDHFKQKKYWDKVEGKPKFKSNKKKFFKKNDRHQEQKEEVAEKSVSDPEYEMTVEPKPITIDPEQVDNEDIGGIEISEPDVEADVAKVEDIDSNDIKPIDEDVTTEDPANDVKFMPSEEIKKESDDEEDKFVIPKTHEEAVKFFAEKDMFHNHQWENPETHTIETITAEEVQKYAGKQNQLVNSIAKSSVDGVYVVTHNGVSKVFNTNEPNNIPNTLVDKENGIIAFPDGVKFNFNELTVIE